MQKRWLNDKQPDENGDYVLIIENSAGNRVSTFKGQSIDEVCDALADSQVAANRQLGKLLRPDRGRDQPLKMEPKEITPTDRLRLSTEINDPNRVVEAVTEIVSATTGAPLKEVGRRVGTIDQNEADAYYRAEAEAFVQEHPDYYPVQQNQVLLFQALEANRYDLTRNNLAIVYNALLDDGKLIPWPEETEPPPNGSAPPSNGNVERPRSYASGLRSSDASASRPAPTKPRPIVTKIEIEKMSRSEYSERLRDPVFRRAVDALQ
jgi:hypothetical protein